MNSTKLILGAVIVVAVIVVGFYSYRMAGAPVVLTPEQKVSADKSLTPTPSNDVSDTAVKQDAAAIDAQMKALDTDTASVDSGLNASAQ